MKKSKKILTITSLGLLPISAVPAIAASCEKQAPENNALNEKISQLEELKGLYTNVLDFLSLQIIEKAIEQANTFRNDTTKQKEIIQLLDNAIKEADIESKTNNDQQKFEKIKAKLGEESTEWQTIKPKLEKQINLNILEQTIFAAQRKKGPYSNDVDDVAFNLIAQAISDAEASFHNSEATTETIKVAINQLNLKIKEADDYFNLSVTQKQQILEDKFNSILNKTKELKETFEKDDAKELMNEKIQEAENINKTDSQFYRKIKNMISELKKTEQEAKRLESLTDQELFDAYILKEFKILSNLEQQFGNDPAFLKIQEKIKKAFKEAREDTSNQYKEKEQNLKHKVNEIIENATAISITPEIANNLYNQETNQIQIPSKVLYIQANSFGNFENLESVQFNDKLVSIGAHAFDNTNLQNIAFPSSLETLSGFENTRVSEVTIPANVTQINFAFDNASNLKTLNLNDKLVELKGFNNTKISQLSLPETLEIFVGFRNTPITNLTLGSKIKTFITSLPELAELTFKANTDFDLVTTNQSATSGILISKNIFPKLQKIYVHSEEDKEKLMKVLGSDIEISDDSELENQKEANNKKIEERKTQFYTYLDFLQKIAHAATKDLTKLTDEQKTKLKDFVSNTNEDELEEDVKYIINRYGYNARATIKTLNEHVAKQKELLDIVGYVITQEKLKDDKNIEDEDVKTNFIETENNFNNSKNEYNNLENNNKEIENKIAKYRLIVQQSEYYIQYLQDIYKNHFLEYNSLSEENQKVVKEILKINDNMPIEEKNNLISGFPYKNNYASRNTFKMTENMIQKYIKLIGAFGYDLSFENIQKDEKLDDETRSDYLLEKTNYEKAKGNEWENIIQIKNS
ncbi:leucine-rich repeat protein [Mycoplasma zalophi]|uniref:leucine-rich repeat domain-containing protein n=1 Tax=Mycoplasma zalophi TaxID=191287 RepID=UPI0021C69999|nr:leucine-rich repeat protein [Mycoplasma zalophi]MCU4117048.1 leucine-rich repeat protein [Mycoplasma zalophi]